MAGDQPGGWSVTTARVTECHSKPVSRWHLLRKLASVCSAAASPIPTRHALSPLRDGRYSVRCSPVLRGSARRSPTLQGEGTTERPVE